MVNDLNKEDANNTIEALTFLEIRLDKYSKDKRRQGRSSQNSFNDTLKRFTNLFNS